MSTFALQNRPLRSRAFSLPDGWLLVTTVVLGEAGLGALVGATHAKLVVGVTIVAVLGVCCMLAPRAALLILAAAWGVVHTFVVDYPLAAVGPVQLTLSRGLGIVILLFLGLAVARLAVTGTQPRVPHPLRALFVFTALMLAIGAVNHPSSAGISDVVRVSTGLVLGVGAFYVFDTAPRFERLLNTVTLGGMLIAGVAITQFLLLQASPSLAQSIFGSASYSVSYTPGDVTHSVGAARVHGTVGGADAAGTLLFVILAFALLRHTIRLDRRRTGWLPVVFILVGIFATLTRTAIVASCVLFFVWSLQRQVQSIGALALRARVALTVGLVTTVAVAGVGATALQSRLSDVNPSSGGSFAQGRGQIWSAEYASLRRSTPAQFVVGEGLHSSYRVLGTSTQPDSPHNLWIWLAVEMGAVGLVAYSIFLLSLGRAVLRGLAERRFELAGRAAGVGAALLAGYFIVDFFILTPPDPSNRWYLMLFVGALLRALSTPRQSYEVSS